MKKESSPGRERGSILWVCLIVLVIIALGGAWYVTTRRMKRPEPHFQAAVVTGKVPPPPARKEEPGMNTDKDPVKATNGQTSAMPLSPGFETSLSEESAAPAPDPLEPSDPGEPADMTSPSSTLALAENPEPLTAEPADEPVLQDSPPADKPAPETVLKKENETAAATAVQFAPAKQSGVTIQVAAFHTKAYAEAMRDELNEKGYAAFIHESTDKKGRIWHMVRFGHFENRGAAAELLARFNQSQKASAIIVRAY